MPKQAMTIYLPEDEYTFLKRYAFEKDQSMSKVVELCVKAIRDGRLDPAQPGAVHEQQASYQADKDEHEEDHFDVDQYMRIQALIDAGSYRQPGSTALEDLQREIKDEMRAMGKEDGDHHDYMEALARVRNRHAREIGKKLREAGISVADLINEEREERF